MADDFIENRPLGIAMAGGVIAIAILDALVKKNVLTMDEARNILTDAQASFSPYLNRVDGALDGARIIGGMFKNFV